MSRKNQNDKQIRRRRGASQWHVAWRRFKKHKAALAGLFIISVFTFIGVFAPFLARYPPASVEPLFEGEFRQPPFWVRDEFPYVEWNLKHPFGTTSEGRDVFSDFIWGTRHSLYIGLAGTSIAAVLAILVGIPSGYMGGKVDDGLMRFTEVILTLPVLLFILLLTRVGQLVAGGALALTVTTLVLGFFTWPGIARVIRGEVLRVREMEFIQACRSIGAGTSRILFRHILPNVLSVLIVFTTLNIATLILIEAGISFLGFGDPNTVTWGQILNVGYVNVVGEWWTEITVGLMMLIAIVGFNLVGDGLSDALNPRLKE